MRSLLGRANRGLIRLLRLRHAILRLAILGLAILGLRAIIRRRSILRRRLSIRRLAIRRHLYLVGRRVRSALRVGRRLAGPAVCVGGLATAQAALTNDAAGERDEDEEEREAENDPADHGGPWWRISGGRAKRKGGEKEKEKEDERGRDEQML